jgi:Calcineurin-like phosphoesterase
MKRLHLLAIACAMLLSGVTHAQEKDQFPKLSPVPGTGELIDNPTTRFTFVAAGDNRPSGGKIKQPKTLSHILKNLKRYNPSFVLWSGDTIGGFREAGKPMHRGHLIKQYEKFFAVVAEAGVPVFNSPGNHEMDRVDKVKDGKKKETTETPDKRMEKLYLEMMKYPKGAPPYGAFNYGNSRFIAVDTEEVPEDLTLRSPGKTVANGLKLDPGFVSQKQIDLLEADLEANKDKTHIFVFMHHPINPAKNGSRLNQANADKLEKIFAKYRNVSFVIAAHEHIYYNYRGTQLNPAKRKSGSAGGPTYLVSGGAGAPLDSCPGNSTRNCLAAYHYLVFEVNGDEVAVKVKLVPAKTKEKQD